MSIELKKKELKYFDDNFASLTTAQHKEREELQEILDDYEDYKYQIERNTKMEYFICPNCHCDNQDMIVGMGDNMMYCEACEHDFHELRVITKEDKNGEAQ